MLNVSVLLDPHPPIFDIGCSRLEVGSSMFEVSHGGASACRAVAWRRLILASRIQKRSTGVPPVSPFNLRCLPFIASGRRRVRHWMLDIKPRGDLSTIVPLCRTTVEALRGHLPTSHAPQTPDPLALHSAPRDGGRPKTLNSVQRTAHPNSRSLHHARLFRLGKSK
jgi:hypothetical protein